MDIYGRLGMEAILTLFAMGIMDGLEWKRALTLSARDTYGQLGMKLSLTLFAMDKYGRLRMRHGIGARGLGVGQP